ncbi:hypothetical protein LINGRAHAP2_LOCUS24400 [Linum grandiflorum]
MDDHIRFSAQVLSCLLDIPIVGQVINEEADISRLGFDGIGAILEICPAFPLGFLPRNQADKAGTSTENHIINTHDDQISNSDLVGKIVDLEKFVKLSPRLTSWAHSIIREGDAKLKRKEVIPRDS